MEEPVLKVERLSHRYSIQWAIRDINFEIPAKGIYGLLGSNGAGKSTTMNIICGVIKQTEGQVFVKGIDTRVDPVGAKRLIGFLPQKPPLYNDLTVEEYLTHTARLRWVEKDKLKPAVEEAMEVHFRDSNQVEKWRARQTPLRAHIKRSRRVAAKSSVRWARSTEGRRSRTVQPSRPVAVTREGAADQRTKMEEKEVIQKE